MKNPVPEELLQVQVCNQSSSSGDRLVLSDIGATSLQEALS